MTAKKRSGDMTSVPAFTIHNAVSQRHDGPTQAKKLKGTVSSPSPKGYSKIKGAVNGPK